MMQIAKTAAAIITILVAIAVFQHSTGWAQGNNAPDMAKPSSTTSLKYLFPHGNVAELSFPSDPATDTDGDTITYRFVFTVPDTSTVDTTDTTEVVYTVPDTSTVGDTTDTTEVEPSDALFSLSQSGNSFEFKGKTGTTPHQFNALYGETATYSVPVKMYASEHSNKRAWSAGPAVGSPAWCWDGTGRTSTAVSSLWPGPDDNPPAQNGADELFSVTLVVSRRPTA